MAPDRWHTQRAARSNGNHLTCAMHVPAYLHGLSRLFALREALSGPLAERHAEGHGHGVGGGDGKGLGALRRHGALHARVGLGEAAVGLVAWGVGEGHARVPARVSTEWREDLDWCPRRFVPVVADRAQLSHGMSYFTRHPVSALTVQDLNKVGLLCVRSALPPTHPCTRP